MQTSYYQRSKISFANVPWFYRFSLVKDLRKFSIFYVSTFIRQSTPTPVESLEYKLYKLASLREIFSKEFQACYVPERKLAVDEQYIGMKDRFSIIQYMPKKPK